MQPARVGHTQRAHEVGILSVRLARPPPAGIARHVEDGRERLELAHRAHLTPDDVGHFLRRRGVPRRREPDRGGELCEVRRDHAAHRFVVEDRRDLEPRLRHEVTLDGVDRLRDLLGRLVPDQTERGNMPDALLQLFVKLTLDGAVSAEQPHGKDGGKLHGFFLNRHLLEQRVRALLCGEVGVCRPTRGWLLSTSSACQQNKQQPDDNGRTDGQEAASGHAHDCPPPAIQSETKLEVESNSRRGCY